MSSVAELIERTDGPTVALRAKLFRGLADASRLSILDALRTEPLSVGEIVAITGLSQSNASNHLRCLSECGLAAGECLATFWSTNAAVFLFPTLIRIKKLSSLIQQNISQILSIIFHQHSNIPLFEECHC